MNEIFRFKQFEVDQQGCAMRINTDGVLLGAFAALQHGETHRILDIGTGTGVIALMLAQRYRQAFVDAIDIEEQAFIRSQTNFRNGPFAERMDALHVGIEDFEISRLYNLIVSNPPFFIDSLKNVDNRKTLSRHGSLSFYQSLFEKVGQLLTGDGSFVIVWPIEIRNRLIKLGYTSGMHNYREIFIQSFPESEPFRVISFFTKRKSTSYSREIFYIYKEQGRYSRKYVELLKDFFLNF